MGIMENGVTRTSKDMWGDDINGGGIYTGRWGCQTKKTVIYGCGKLQG